MNIYITGFMGTGKTAVGQEIARQKKMPFVDLDELIEERHGMAIPQIFQEKGEPYFRAQEKKLLAEIARKDGQVVSCGGGIVCEPDNIAAMKKTGVVVCLTATPEIILERTRIFKNRPLLNVANPLEKIKSLLTERASCYAQADTTIDTSGLSPQEVAQQALGFIVQKS